MAFSHLMCRGTRVCRQRLASPVVWGSCPARDAERPGHVRPEGGEAELGYMFLPEAWGCGYAPEACAAALDWFAGALPGEPVVLSPQTANDRSMRLAAKLGFTEGAVRGVRR